MLKQVAYVSVFVQDQDKALDFYTNVLGFEKGINNPTPGGPRFLTVGVKRARGRGGPRWPVRLRTS